MVIYHCEIIESKTSHYFRIQRNNKPSNEKHIHEYSYLKANDVSFLVHEDIHKNRKTRMNFSSMDLQVDLKV